MAWNLVSSARDANVESLIYFSSVDAYGRSPELPMSETTSLDPDTWYGLSKSTCEWIVREELRSKGPTCILRIPGIFWMLWERQERHRPVNREHPESGEGVHSRRWQAAPGLRFCSGSLPDRRTFGCAHGRRTFNVATGTSVSLLQILEDIREALGIDFEVVHLPANVDRSFDMRYDIARPSANSILLRYVPASAVSFDS